MTVGILAALAHLMTDVVAVEARIGQDEYNVPQYGPASLITARVERDSSRTIDVNGIEMVLTVAVYTASPIAPDARLRLDDGSVVVAYLIEAAKDVASQPCYIARAA